ncbi:hypothetical protein B0H10DRAFT_352109 [Mycena sp. CBHHK59/15]|nr:hypothetical protein B0H10DRAFT_352109 [Mycena sp. CBHHK59/15]
MFEHALKAFGWMRAFDGFTGNGSGDADSDDPTAILKSKLSAARKAGLPIGGLSPAKILEWEKNGWSDLFNNRFGTSAKVMILTSIFILNFASLLLVSSRRLLRLFRSLSTRRHRTFGSK